MFLRLDEIEARLESLERQLMDPALSGQRDRFREVTQEHSEVGRMAELVREMRSLEQARDDAAELMQDPDMRELALAERDRVDARLPELERLLKLMMLPRDPYEGRPILLEIRAGTGGDEAALFAGDLFRMYTRFGERRGWRMELMSSSEISASGSSSGFKEVVCAITGETAYSHLKYESGVHRVQRVPATETQGRIHTSTATVAIMPEPDEIEVKVADKDLRIDVFRAGGPGGQSVNTTDSAVRITHLPTGTVVICQDEKSQTKNKSKAMKVLLARLLEKQRDEQHAIEAAHRRDQVGTGDRSERIRTYNFPQNRLTDHRIGLTLYKLDAVIEGDLEELVTGLVSHFQAEALSAAEGPR